jgi:hypothetical protein
MAPHRPLHRLFPLPPCQARHLNLHRAHGSGARSRGITETKIRLEETTQSYGISKHLLRTCFAVSEAGSTRPRGAPGSLPFRCSESKWQGDIFLDVHSESLDRSGENRRPSVPNLDRMTGMRPGQVMAEGHLVGFGQ